MTEKEFVVWFKGFVAAANSYNITPKQWDIVCEYLEKVKEPSNNSGYTISLKDGTYGTTTTSERRGDTTYKNDNPETKTLLND
jgi:hypothetical protein